MGRLFPPIVALEGRTWCTSLERILSLDIFFQKRRFSEGDVSLVAESKSSIQIPLLVLLDLPAYRDARIESWLADSNVPSGFRQCLTEEIVSMAINSPANPVTRIDRCLADSNVPSELWQSIIREIISMATDLSDGLRRGCEIDIYVHLYEFPES